MGNATEAPHNARFGRGTNFILLDNVHCEVTRRNCHFAEQTGLEIITVTHSEDAGVICSQGGEIYILFYQYLHSGKQARREGKSQSCPGPQF